MGHGYACPISNEIAQAFSFGCRIPPAAPTPAFRAEGLVIWSENQPRSAATRSGCKSCSWAVRAAGHLPRAARVGFCVASAEDQWLQQVVAWLRFDGTTGIYSASWAAPQSSCLVKNEVWRVVWQEGCCVPLSCFCYWPEDKDLVQNILSAVVDICSLLILFGINN